MALRNFDNSNSSRVVSTLSDGGLSNPATVIIDQRVVVIGMFKNVDSPIPVQELYPNIPGSVTMQDLIDQCSNKSEDATPILYPSEVSIALEELAASGIENVQVIRAANDARVKDMTARMARQRYIAYENAYELLFDVPIDYIYAVNVVAGQIGDSLYNNNGGTGAPDLSAGSGVSVEVAYDPARYSELLALDPTDVRVTFAGLTDFVALDTVSGTKGDGNPINSPEDLVYQLADASYTLSTSGNFCISTTRSMNAVERKHLVGVKLGTDGVSGTDIGATASAVSNVTADGETWAFAKFNTTDSILSGYDLAGVDTLVDNATIINFIEDGGYVVDRATNQALTGTAVIKPSLKVAIKPVYDPIDTTLKQIQYINSIQWDLFFGAPGRNDMRVWDKFINSFGNELNGVSKYDSLDGVTDTDGNGIADNYKFFATSTHEQPSGELDAAIIKDNNGNPIDIGPYIDCIAANSISNLGKNTDRISSVNRKSFTFLAGIGQIISWYTTVPSNRATTRLSTVSIGKLGFIGGRTISDLTRNRYQVFFDDDGIYTLSRDITMGKFVNTTNRTNFINRFTVRVVKDAIDIAQQEGNKFLGKADSPEVKASIKQRLEQEYTLWASPVDRRLRKPATVEVLSDGTDAVIGKIIIKLKLAVSKEILEINVQTILE